MKTEKLEKSGGSQIFAVADQPKTAATMTEISVASLNDDLLLLLELGALQKVLDLSRNYNFFNVHGALFYVAISTRQLKYAEEVLIDLIIGPFVDRDSEFFMRGLYLLNIIENYQLSPSATKLLEKYQSGIHFENWKKTLTKLDSEASKIKALKDLALITQKTLAKFGDLKTVKIFTPDNIIKVHKNFESYKSDYFNSKEVEEDRTISDLIFHQALANLECYIENSQDQYRDTLLKTDFEYIYKSLSQDAVRELALRCSFYDFHPLIALRYFELGRIDETLSVLHELAEQSDLFAGERGFKVELAKSAVCDLMIKTLAECGEEAREEYGPLILSILPPIRHQEALYACRGKCDTQLDSSALKRNLEAFSTYKVVLREAELREVTQDLQSLIVSLQEQNNHLK